LLQDGWRISNEAVQSIPGVSFLKTYPEILASLGGAIPWAGMLIVALSFNLIFHLFLFFQWILPALYRKCPTNSESWPIMRNFMLLCCHSGVTTSPGIARNSTISISTCIWSMQTSPDDFFNRNILFVLYLHHHMHHLPNNLLLS
jgi:hypothetical protein